MLQGADLLDGRQGLAYHRHIGRHMQHVLRHLVDGPQAASAANHQHAIAHALHHHILNAPLQAQQLAPHARLALLQPVIARRPVQNGRDQKHDQQVQQHDGRMQNLAIQIAIAVVPPVAHANQQAGDDHRHDRDALAAQHRAHNGRQRQQGRVIGNTALAKPHQQKIHQQIQSQSDGPIPLKPLARRNGCHQQARSQRGRQVRPAQRQRPYGKLAAEIHAQRMQRQQQKRDHHARRHKALPNALAGT